MMKFITGLAVVTAATLIQATPAHAESNLWGAISIGNNHTVAAIATYYPTWQAAASAADRECGYTDCGYVIAWYNMCGSAASGPAGWGWAREYSLGSADQVAMRNAGFGADWVVHGCTG